MLVYGRVEEAGRKGGCRAQRVAVRCSSAMVVGGAESVKRGEDRKVGRVEVI